MTDFIIHNAETAPTEARAHLQGLQDGLGFIPNVYAVTADSTVALQALLALGDAVSKTSFNATEQQIIQIATSTVNECGYCVAGHTFFAEMQGLPRDVIQAVRNGHVIADEKLEGLRKFTLALVRQRGHVMPLQINKFLNAGYSQAQIMELVVAVVTKLFSNFVAIATDIPLDDAFAPYEWPRPSQAIDASFAA